MPRRLTFALLQALHLLPPVLSWTSGSRYVLWFASSLLIATAVMWLWESGDFKKRLCSPPRLLQINQLVRRNCKVILSVKGWGLTIARPWSILSN